MVWVMVEGSKDRREEKKGGEGGGALNPTRIPNCVRPWSTSYPPLSIYPHFSVGKGEKKEPVKSFVDTALGIGLSSTIEYQGRDVVARR